MTTEELFQLYLREREYQRQVFGEYSKSPLNVASFLILHQEYTKKAQSLYIQQWDHSLPPWLLNTIEFSQQGSAPVKTYQEIIKNFALHGACLETFIHADPRLWRWDGKINQKWEAINGQTRSENSG